MKIVITGGHLTPALAVIDAIRIQDSDTSLHFIGRKYTREGDTSLSVEYDLVTKKSIPFYSIITGRIQRTLTRHTIPSLLRIPIGCIQSFFILYKLKPDLVLSFGGYIAVPVSIAAWIRRIPVITHEQTLKSGLANKVISKFATKVIVSFPPTQKDFPQNKTVLIGNPIRKEVQQIRESIQINMSIPLIYITGGNMGSQSINNLVFAIISQLATNYVIVHQTGNAFESKDFKHAMHIKQTLNNPSRYLPYEYIGPDLIGFIMQRSEVIIGRSGANTVCEVLALGKKAIFLPLNAEQQANALYAQATGLTETIATSVTPQEFLKKIEQLVTQTLEPSLLEKAKSLMPIDADKKIADIIFDEIKKA